MKLAFAIGVITLLAVPVVWAEDAPKPPAPPVKETWTTSEGTVTLQVLPFSFQGIYDQDNGRMVGVLTERATFVGYWGEDSSGEECKTTMLGTKFWGHISFTFDASRQHYDGKWGYCDDAATSDSDWTGDIAK